MTVSEFRALSKYDKSRFEYTVDKAEAEGKESIHWLPMDIPSVTLPVFLWTLKGKHLLKHCI